MTRVLVIGGGPAGLVFSILLAKLQPNYQIDLWEPRFQNFTRKITLVLNSLVLSLLSTTIDEDIRPILVSKKYSGCFVKPPALDHDAECFTETSGFDFISIRIDKLENLLSEYILKFSNITIIKKKFNANSFTLNTIQKYTLLISASGGRDNVDNFFLQSESKTIPLSYGMVITFNPKKHETIESEDGFTKLRNSQNRYRGFRSQNSTYYLGIQISHTDLVELSLLQEEYGEIMFDKMSKLMKEAIESGLNKYKMEPEDINKMEYSFFPIINNYRTDTAGFIGLHNSIAAFLIGDSSGTTHFFSGNGVNTAIIAASELAFDLTKHLSLKKIILDHNKRMRQINAELLFQSKRSTRNMDEFTYICGGLTSIEINEIAKKIGFNTKGMTDLNVCLSFSDFIIDKFVLPKTKKRGITFKKNKECYTNQIINPNTGKCVSKTGKIGQEILLKKFNDYINKEINKSSKRKSSKRKSSKRKPSKRKPSKRKSSKRKSSKRKPSKRKPSKRKSSKRKPSKRKPSKRKSSKRKSSKRKPSKRKPSKRKSSKRKPSKRKSSKRKP